jgi:hypothetical protein
MRRRREGARRAPPRLRTHIRGPRWGRASRPAAARMPHTAAGRGCRRRSANAKGTRAPPSAAAARCPALAPARGGPVAAATMLSHGSEATVRGRVRGPEARWARDDARVGVQAGQQSGYAPGTVQGRAAETTRYLQGGAPGRRPNTLCWPWRGLYARSTARLTRPPAWGRSTPHRLPAVSRQPTTQRLGVS